MNRVPSSGGDPGAGYLLGLFIKTFLIVGLCAGALSFVLLMGLATSYQTDGASTANDWVGWFLQRLFYDGVDPRQSSSGIFGSILWTGMCSFGLFQMPVALVARRVTRQLWEEPRHHVVRYIGAVLFAVALFNPVSLSRVGFPYGLGFGALAWGPAMILIGGCIDRQLRGAEKPVLTRDWVVQRERRRAEQAMASVPAYPAGPVPYPAVPYQGYPGQGYPGVPAPYPVLPYPQGSAPLPAPIPQQGPAPQLDPAPQAAPAPRRGQTPRRSQESLADQPTQPDPASQVDQAPRRGQG